ncbi:tRNA glutamyl-Q(34) synthetase GluQRS [Pirellulaceae bacterium SH449]
MSYIGRLAPSPTGAQHLGNARTYLVAWLHARSQNGKLLLRIEDLDTPRTKTGAENQIFTDLEWLGLDWDSDGHDLGFVRQSDKWKRYTEVLEYLKQRELVYPCTCSRSEIDEAASAPHESFLDGVVYPGSCARYQVSDAARFDSQGLKYAWRFRFTKDSLVDWVDLLAGKQELIPSRALGDFVVARNYGPVAYQLAVVVDDHDAEISCVVRGNDLIYSTYRQLAIYEALGWRAPQWIHVPLVVGLDGRRLAKRHGDTRLSSYRDRGTPPETLLGALASSLGITRQDRPMTAQQILEQVRGTPGWLPRIPAEPFIWRESVP